MPGSRGRISARGRTLVQARSGIRTCIIAWPWYQIFLKPYVSLRLAAKRPTKYPDQPKTLADHLLKRRSELGLLQREVARAVSVNTWTYLLWEKGRTAPEMRYFPAIFRFLGYDPFPAPQTLPERIASKRRALGLSIREAAKLVGVDEGTFGRWESGEWKPRVSREAVDRFLNSPSRANTARAKRQS